MNKLITIFKIPELTRKILITALFLVIYRIGFFIPLPMIDQQAMSEKMAAAAQGAMGQLLGLVSMFSGGSFSQSSIFALGVMPYISASIIFQLLASVYPPLEKLQKEGESGRKKINEYTRYATVFICLIQAYFLVSHIMTPTSANGMGLAQKGFDTFWFGVTGVVTMTAGTIFLMWIGEQIDEYGIGNGISLIIMAGIVARIPDAVWGLIGDPANVWTIPIPFTDYAWVIPALKTSILTLGGGGSGGEVGLEKLLVLLVLFVVVVVGVIAITKGQRRIPTQSAKHVRGRRVFGGTRQFLPLRVNTAGVMPVIFASSLLIVPGLLFQVLYGWSGSNFFGFMADLFGRNGFIYNLTFIVLIYFFCYFWTAIVFNPKDMANNLKDYGSFIPGYRPGKRTADYLERVMMRITYVGAAFLAVVAIIPSMISGGMGINPAVASFFGGTGLLIVVSVALDLVQKINSHLVMRNYPGLTDD